MVSDFVFYLHDNEAYLHDVKTTNRPQVYMGYKLKNHARCVVEHEKNL